MTGDDSGNVRLDLVLCLSGGFVGRHWLDDSRRESLGLVTRQGKQDQQAVRERPLRVSLWSALGF